MTDEDEIKIIMVHYEGSLSKAFGAPMNECDSFNDMIYNRIRKIDLTPYKNELLIDFIEVFKVAKIRAAKARVSPEDRKYVEEIISKSNEQIDILKKILDDRQNKRHTSIKDELDNKKFKWQKISVTISIIAIAISIAAFIFSILFNFLHG